MAPHIDTGGGSLAETKAYGALDGSPYDQTARRLVAVARKAQ